MTSRGDDMQVTGLTLPGLDDSGPTHWQTLWEQADASLVRVQQRDWQRPRCADWVATLDAHPALTAPTGPGIILVAHSLGCLLVAHWAAHTRHTVRGALLVAPPDPDAASFPTVARGFSPLPLAPLPFRSILVYSSDDPYCAAARSEALARAWQSERVGVGAAGHINGQSGLGDWAFGRSLARALAGGNA